MYAPECAVEYRLSHELPLTRDVKCRPCYTASTCISRVGGPLP